jgi:hypothetical protein
MERVLKENDHKNGWEYINPIELLIQLGVRVRELEVALNAQSKERTIKEAIDVANYAMMIADNVMKARLYCLKQYDFRLRKTPELLAALPELVGKFLLCWCKPLPCHGDILLAIMKERKLIDADGFCL